MWKLKTTLNLTKYLPKDTSEKNERQVVSEKEFLGYRPFTNCLVYMWYPPLRNELNELCLWYL